MCFLSVFWVYHIPRAFAGIYEASRKILTSLSYLYLLPENSPEMPGRRLTLGNPNKALRWSETVFTQCDFCPVFWMSLYINGSCHLLSLINLTLYRAVLSTTTIDVLVEKPPVVILNKEITSWALSELSNRIILVWSVNHQFVFCEWNLICRNSGDP